MPNEVYGKGCRSNNHHITSRSPFSANRSFLAKGRLCKSRHIKNNNKTCPRVSCPPEVEIPSAKKQPAEQLGKKKINKWVWVGLGALAAGVLAALSGGGGDGGGNGGGGDDTGTIVINGPAP